MKSPHISHRREFIRYAAAATFAGFPQPSLTRGEELAPANLGDAVEAAEIRAGNLAVTFRDNSKSPKSLLSGVGSLINTVDAPDFNAFDSEAGANAGLNFEHIISGHNREINRFTPRIGRYALHPLPDGRSVVLVRNANDSPCAVASTMTYSVVPPHYIDFTFRCRTMDAARFGDRRWAIFFFADYMNDVQDIALHFLGRPSADAREQWIAGDAPSGHRDYNKGGTYHHLDAPQLGYDEDHNWKLNCWAYDWPRYTQPFYFGRAAHDITFILMFDRGYSEVDEVRLSLFKFKLTAGVKRPAWDFQYVVHRVEPDRTYGFRGRLAWKRFVSEDDCLREYQAWRGSLAGWTIGHSPITGRFRDT